MLQGESASSSVTLEVKAPELQVLKSGDAQQAGCDIAGRTQGTGHLGQCFFE